MAVRDYVSGHSQADTNRLTARVAIFFHNLSNIGQKPVPRQHRLKPKRRKEPSTA